MDSTGTCLMMPEYAVKGSKSLMMAIGLSSSMSFRRKRLLMISRGARNKLERKLFVWRTRLLE